MNRGKMMDSDSAGNLFRNFAAVCVWIGGVSLGDVQVAVSIITGVIVGAYSAVNLYVLWRDKIKGGRDENTSR
jgi:hypothetical protein